MKRLLPVSLLFLLAATLAGPVSSAAKASDAANSTSHPATASGFWQGAIAIPNSELGIAVTLESADAETWTGTIDIPSQGLKAHSLTNVAVEGDTVHFEMGGIPGTPTFHGTLSESGDEITGSFQQGPQSLTFSLERSTMDSTETAVAAQPPLIPGEGVVGDWLGPLDVGPVVLRLALHVEAAKDTKDGSLEAILNSIDQGAKMPVDTVTLEGKSLKLTIKAIGGSFEGTLNEDGSAIEGTWSQGPQEMPLTFHRTQEAVTLHRPQEPQAPFPYEAREVTFRNEEDAVDLAGTLITPDGSGPFPAVLFISGSGAQDRDEALMGHKPFLVIADYLARRGIASLRYDDRGAGESGGNHFDSTVGDFAEDARAGVAFLASQAKINPKAVGIVGHSEGGLAGPRVATTTELVDFLVLLAGPGEPLDALLARQSRDMLLLNGVDAALVERAAESQKGDLALIKDNSLSSEELAMKLREKADREIAELTEEEKAALGIQEQAIEQGIGQVTTPWFRSLMQEEPAVYLRALKVPVLALFGEKDIQVAPDINSKIVRASLEEAGNEDFEVRIMPGLNHLFQHATTGAIAEYSTIEETFAPQALELIGDWITERFGAN